MKTIDCLAILSVLFSFIINTSSATTHKVGPTQTYSSPNALYQANVIQDGDTIEIDSATYAGNDALAVWQKNNLFIRGGGGRPKLVANGQYILGKGIWVLAGNDITVENIEFTGAQVPDKNGAGIRLDGEGLTVRHCYFHDNENGILTSNPGLGEILIEYSEFAGNGFGDGFSHNLYIGVVGKLTFRFNYTHRAKIGHLLKSRAKQNFILYNRIMDEDTGNSSRLIDLPNGGFSIIMGNLLMQGPNAENNNMIGYGLEGLFNAAINDLYIVHNTFVNKRVASCLFIDLTAGAESSLIANNIFAGTGTVIQGQGVVQHTYGNNLIETHIDSVGFIDEVNYDYHLSPNAHAIDLGLALSPVSGHSLTPDFAYKHLASSESRSIVNNPDAGAYELNNGVGFDKQLSDQLKIFPNPVTDGLRVELSAKQLKNIKIYDSLGHLYMMSNENRLDVSQLPAGVYWLRVETLSGQMAVKPFVKCLSE